MYSIISMQETNWRMTSIDAFFQVNNLGLYPNQSGIPCVRLSMPHLPGPWRGPPPLQALCDGGVKVLLSYGIQLGLSQLNKVGKQLLQDVLSWRASHLPIPLSLQGHGGSNTGDRVVLLALGQMSQ